MATLVSSPSSPIHVSKHFLSSSNKDAYAPFHRLANQSSSATHTHDAFAAFGHGNNHSRSSSLASSTSSWRTHAAPLPSSPLPTPPSQSSTSKSVHKSSRLSHRRSGSSSSASSDDSRAEQRSAKWSPVNRAAALPSPATPSADTAPSPSKPGLYTLSDLLSLEASPLVGLNPQKQAVVEEFVAHHVYRRSQQRSPAGRGRKSGHARADRSQSRSESGSSSPRSTAGSIESDDSFIP